MSKERLVGKWDSLKELDDRRFRCGYCGSVVASHRGWQTDRGIAMTGDYRDGEIRVCPSCNQPTYVRQELGLGPPDEVARVPRPMPGTDVRGLPADIESLYTEARRAHAAEAFTAAVLALRKLLMHIAVEKEAKPGDTFKTYLEYLDNNNYLGRGGKPWVGRILKRSNDANHQIVLMVEEDSKHLMTLAEMLLKLVYEFPGRLEPDKEK